MMGETSKLSGNRRSYDLRTAGYTIAPNLLGSNFTTAQPKQGWLAEINYVSTNGGWL
jgi:hypothetical protein